MEAGPLAHARQRTEGEIREQTKNRAISAGPRNDRGWRYRDTFIRLKRIAGNETCRSYLQDRSSTGNNSLVAVGTRRVRCSGPPALRTTPGGDGVDRAGAGPPLNARRPLAVGSRVPVLGPPAAHLGFRARNRFGFLSSFAFRR